MTVAELTDQIRNIIKESQIITLILPKNIDLDLVCSMMAWRNELKRRDKKLRMIVLDIDKSEYSWVPYINEIQSSLPLQRSVVKVGFSSGSVKKISYEFKGDDLYLYLFPKSGRITEEQVEVYSEQVDSDLIITLGITQPIDLGEDFVGWLDKLSEDQMVLNIDINIRNTQFGKVNLINGEVLSMSQFSSEMFRQLNWEVDAETATLLIRGIRNKSCGFTVGVTSQVFEEVANLMKNGGIINDGVKK